jgi:hypothetical protein
MLEEKTEHTDEDKTSCTGVQKTKRLPEAVGKNRNAGYYVKNQKYCVSATGCTVF